MTITLFVEGETEKKALPGFFKRWLDPQLPTSVRIRAIELGGWGKFLSTIDRHVSAELEQRSRQVPAIVAGLLDLQGPEYPGHITTNEARRAWATSLVRGKSSTEDFRLYFAIQETEAWLLSDAAIFPQVVQPEIRAVQRNPESISKPAELLNRVYQQHLGRNYKKVVDGTLLFSRLDPHLAVQRCPALNHFLNEMLEGLQAQLRPS